MPMKVGGLAGAPKQLASLCPADTSEATLYTCGLTASSGRGVVECEMLVTNITGTAANATVAFLKGGGSTANKDYIIKTVSIAGSSIPLPLPIPPFEATDLVKVTAGTANALAFRLWGVELA